jgi:S-formylglutathione hydrolase FrmB
MYSAPTGFSSPSVSPTQKVFAGAPSIASSANASPSRHLSGTNGGRLRSDISVFRLFPLFLFACLFFAASTNAVPGRVECNSVASKILARPVSYCVVLPPSFDANQSLHFPILYFLHGLGDNEQFLVHSGLWNVVEDLRANHELKDFLIATPDGGAGFYINSKDGKSRYEDFLLQEFFPFIEKRYRVSPGRANRAIDGVSMGGYGSLHLAFRHPQLFSSASAHSAAIIEKIPAFAAGIPPSPRTRVFGGVFGNPLDPAFWEQNSPLTLARTANLSGLKIYFDCGDQDDYGFEAGATALDKILTTRHIPHEFHLYPGRHDFTYFAAHIPASLAFANNAFPK